jgi:starch-binding outer membrane protein, SusD/RagB family
MTILCFARTRRQRAGRPRPAPTRPTRHAAWMVAPVLAATLLGSCKDSNVPLLTGPTQVAATTVGVQNAVTGLFSAARNDVGNYVIFMSTFSRDAANFTSTEPRWVTEGMGLIPIPNTDFFFSSSIWDIEYRNAKFANQIIATLPSVVPKYSAADAATITGVVQTMKALQFMMLAETRDTLGVSPYSIDGGSTPAPVFCNKDVWRYIVALLDSGNVALQAAGTNPLPIILPPGFASVSAMAAPSTSPGAFAAFNRALAGKAGMELAYAIARNAAGTAPTAATSGSPDALALGRADSAMHASALFSPAALTTPAPGGFTDDAFGVYHSWSAQSGDQLNPVNGVIGTLAVLWDMVADADTVNDARWHAKFAVNVNTVQTSFAPAASPYSYAYYPSVSTPIPIVRNEELTLVDAQIQLGLGNLANATTLINTVHQQAGGFGAPLTIPADYVDVRNALLKEQRISTILEASEDRTISLRMYGMATVSDTTWNATSGPDAAAVVAATNALGAKPTDLHTLVDPPPATEADGRGGSFTLTCTP